MNLVKIAGPAFFGTTLLALTGCSFNPPSAQDLDRPPSGLLVEEQEVGKSLPPAGLQIRPVHPKGLKLTKVSEGWVARLYNDAAGYCTIGYGHLIKKSRCNGTEPTEFLSSITEARGTTLLTEDMGGAQIAVATAVKVPINDLQYSALTDFVFNVGAANFRSSTLLKRINANQFDQVPVQLRRWTQAGGKTYPGLVTRREREIALFFDGQPVPRELPRAGEDVSEVDVRTGEKR